MGLLMTTRAFEWGLVLLLTVVLSHREMAGWTAIILEYGSDGAISLLKAHADSP